jgi:hypothetical protein
VECRMRHVAYQDRLIRVCAPAASQYHGISVRVSPGLSNGVSREGEEKNHRDTLTLDEANDQEL